MGKRLGKAATKNMQNYEKLCIIREVKHNRFTEFLREHKLTDAELIEKYGEEYFNTNNHQLNEYRKEFGE